MPPGVHASAERKPRGRLFTAVPPALAGSFDPPTRQSGAFLFIAALTYDDAGPQFGTRNAECGTKLERGTRNAEVTRKVEENSDLWFRITSAFHIPTSHFVPHSIFRIPNCEVF